MRKLFITVFLLIQSKAAVKTVCPVSMGTCNYTDIITPLVTPGALSCGDELDLAAIRWNVSSTNLTIAASTYNCPANNPVTITSMRKAFLPLPAERLSPSHVYNQVPVPSGVASTGNVAVINTTDTSPALTLFGPNNGLTFIGVGFTTSPGKGLTYNLLSMEGETVGITNLSQVNNNIVVDRCYVSGPETATPATKTEVGGGILVQGANITVKNSFIKDLMYRGAEAHGIYGSDAVGPVTYTNNFVSAAAENVFSGGNQTALWPANHPNYGVIPNGFTAQYNYFFKPHKWWNDPVHNPDFADYLAFGAGQYNPGANWPITATTNGSPDVLTAPGNTLANGQYVMIDGATGDTAINGPDWIVTNVAGSTFQITSASGGLVNGSGNYTASSGTVHVWPGYEPCMKNLGENKNGQNILWQFNVYENEPINTSECQGQSFGFTFTPRAASGSYVYFCAAGTGVCNNYPYSNQAITGTVIDSTHMTYTKADQLVITATTGGSPDTITVPGNTLKNGQVVDIGGATGDTAINTSYYTGPSTVQNIGISGPGTFQIYNPHIGSLQSGSGAGSYTGGGAIFPPSDGQGDGIQANSTPNSYGIPTLPMPNGGQSWACPYNTANTHEECRYVTSVVYANGGGTITVAPDPVTGLGWDFTGVAGGGSGFFTFGNDASEAVLNVAVANNVFRNVNKAFNLLMVDASPNNNALWHPGTIGVSVQNLNISNNLWENTMLMCQSPCANSNSMWGLNLFNSQNPEDPTARVLPSGLTLDHNTFYYADALNPASSLWFTLNMGAWSGANTTPIDKFKFSNNILPQSGSKLVRQDSFGNTQVSVALAEYETGNAMFQNNSVPGFLISAPCTGGQSCSGNLNNLTGLDQHFINAAQGIFKIAPLSPMAKAGNDLLDLGANFDRLPLINNLNVTSQANTATIDWELSGVNNSIPCVVEVSPSRNLYSGLGPYAVVNDLNPVLFLQPDTDRRTNSKLPQPIISGRHRTFIVGTQASVADDNDGTVRSLALTPATEYWGRLMCGGDTETFQFVTSGMNAALNPGAAVAVSIKVQAPAGTVTARISYGATQSLGSTLDAQPDSSGNAEFQLPVMPGVATFYQMSFIGAQTVTLPMQSL